MGRIAYDPLQPTVDYSVFNDTANWKPFYGDVEEELPPKMPEPLGHPVSIHAFVDANHAGNVVTRRSHSGIIILEEEELQILAIAGDQFVMPCQACYYWRHVWTPRQSSGV